MTAVVASIRSLSAEVCDVYGSSAVDWFFKQRTWWCFSNFHPFHPLECSFSAPTKLLYFILHKKRAPLCTWICMDLWFVWRSSPEVLECWSNRRSLDIWGLWTFVTFWQEPQTSQTSEDVWSVSWCVSCCSCFRFCDLPLKAFGVKQLTTELLSLSPSLGGFNGKAALWWQSPFKRECQAIIPVYAEFVVKGLAVVIAF